MLQRKTEYHSPKTSQKHIVTHDIYLTGLKSKFLSKHSSFVISPELKITFCKLFFLILNKFAIIIKTEDPIVQKLLL